MQNDTSDLVMLADDTLLAEVQRLAARSSAVTAALVAHLAEVDRRKLYLGLGHPSMFAYCTERLGLAEGSAYNRIEAARASTRFPLVLELLRGGRINLNTVRLLSPHLTGDNHRAVLEEAADRPRSAVEAIVVRLHPRPAVAPSLRRLPAPTAPRVSLPTPAPRVVAPLAPELYRLIVSMDGVTRERWQRLREHFAGDDAAVLAKTLEAALAAIEKPKTAVTPRPTADHSRHIPEALRREVAKRDGGQCTFVGRDGRRCSARRHLQCDHVKPWEARGASTAENLRLRCGPHNRHEARRFFAASREAGRLGSWTG